MTAGARRVLAVTAALAVIAVTVALAATRPDGQGAADATAPASPTPSIAASRAPRRPAPPRRPSRELRRGAAVFAADWLDMLAGKRLASQVRNAAPAVIEQHPPPRPPGGPGARAIAGPPQLAAIAGAGEGSTVRVRLRRGAPLQFVIAAGPSGPTVYEVRLD